MWTFTLTLEPEVGRRLELLALACGWTPRELLEREVLGFVDPDADDPRPLPHVGAGRSTGAGPVPLRVDVPGVTAARLVVAAADRRVGVGSVASWVLVGAPDGAVGLAAARAAAVRDAVGSELRSKLEDEARRVREVARSGAAGGGDDRARAGFSSAPSVGDPAPYSARIDAFPNQPIQEDEHHE